MSESVAKHYLKSVPSSASISAQKPAVLLAIEPPIAAVPGLVIIGTRRGSILKMVVI